MDERLIEVRDLDKVYQAKSFFKTSGQANFANQGINIDIYQGEVLGLVGESGSGKSTLGRLLLGFEKSTSGQINYFPDQEGSQADFSPQIVFQNNLAAMNPQLSVLDVVAEPLLRSQSKAEAREAAKTYLNQVGIPEDKWTHRPRSFSGGQLQRVNIARALADQPNFIVLDEPVSALDVSVQASIINLLMDLQEDHQLTYLFITHDLSIARVISDRIAVMKEGHLVEVQATEALFENPQEAYTRDLLAAIPSLKV
ncbi:ATP-binding cassette domain-containing protein [Aerococcus sanguinicola]|uniref:ABC transporter ATP-binding protein n=1 Tax=Aerococcus sanguinicola TaxID=119206 RepID=A0A120I991_9LACT|nr:MULTISPECIES: ATP-binding cassette domain-containing protein [Aerococcus]AMB94178.1 hypothetical protein AWM72_05120 [Aerococcus sanguinicola]MDK7050046.1 ATP-binding cassette domain-containing protein [Aerococcus sanguinicola]OFT92323.1 hypothetical protein HMPREF3090_08975 [Aerococcus sp. HMSC23C02]PKZ22352.1 ABC transporter ATP-binding protein [Aerococcus sanguinicola]